MTGIDSTSTIANEAALLAAARAFIDPVTELTPSEREAVAGIGPESNDAVLTRLRHDIAAGGDPLGVAFARLRPALVRRDLGATYTPPEIVAPMLRWAVNEGPAIQRVVDPGAGSGRFLLAAVEAFPDAALVGIEVDPVAALLLRANLAVRGLAHRAQVIVGDYREAALPPTEGMTLFIGNPPYLRHHGIAPHWKAWYAAAARRHGVKASTLAGLHVHFFLRTLDLARRGDLGCFVTAAEWLDVNYGAALRHLFAGALGGQSLHRLDPKALPFADAVTTGVIACFRIGVLPENIRLQQATTVGGLGDLSGGAPVRRADLASASRWSDLPRKPRAVPPGWVELGELCRVHRGQVTGGNAVWIAGPESAGLPERFLFPAITKARELLRGDVLDAPDALRRVIDLPRELDPADGAVAPFLAWARSQGADLSYIARHRKAWWSVGLTPPAPILSTYMARRPPAFVRNLCGARHINIAHGIYPREPMPEATLDALAAFLRANVAQSAGRTYAGGLTKFEPKELERILVPRPEELVAIAAPAA